MGKEVKQESVMVKQVKCPSCKDWRAAFYYTSDQNGERVYDEQHYCPHCRIHFEAEAIE